MTSSPVRNTTPCKRRDCARGGRASSRLSPRPFFSLIAQGQTVCVWKTTNSRISNSKALFSISRNIRCMTGRASEPLYFSRAARCPVAGAAIPNHKARAPSWPTMPGAVWSWTSAATASRPANAVPSTVAGTANPVSTVRSARIAPRPGPCPARKPARPRACWSTAKSATWMMSCLPWSRTRPFIPAPAAA